MPPHNPSPDEWDEPALPRATRARRRAPAHSDFDRPKRRGKFRWNAATILLLAIAVLLLLLFAGAVWFFLLRTPSAVVQSGSPPSAAGASAPGAAGSFAPSVLELRPTPGNMVAPAKAGDGTPTVVVASRMPSASSAGTTGGAYVAIAPNVAQTLSGRLIVVQVTARAAAANPTNRFAVAFSTGTLGDSGWITFVPTADFKPYQMRLRVPASQQAGENYIGIWADVSGLGRSLEISAISVTVVQ